MSYKLQSKLLKGDSIGHYLEVVKGDTCLGYSSSCFFDHGPEMQKRQSAGGDPKPETPKHEP